MRSGKSKNVGHTVTGTLLHFWIYKKDWIVALLLILIGGMIYVLYRPETLLLFRVTDSLGITPLIDIARSNTSSVVLPSFVINSLPAGLWTASYLIMMYVTTKYHSRRIRLMLALPLPSMAIVMEFMQIWEWCPGTFDIYDLICYIVPMFVYIKSIK